MRPACFWAYMRWSAMRRASAASVGLGRERDRAVGAADPEALALLAQAPARRRRAASTRSSEARLEQRAELVAAHAEDGPARAEVLAQVAAQAGQQDVAGGVAEGVVVVLEAVEVEQREHERGLGTASASASSRARVSARRLPSPVSASVSASSREARSMPTFWRKVSVSRIITNTSAAAARRDGERVEVAERAVDEQLERDRARGQRRGDQPQRVGGGARRGARGGGLPGGERDQEEARPTSRRRTSRRPRRCPRRRARGTSSPRTRRAGCRRPAAPRCDPAASPCRPAAPTPTASRKRSVSG